MEEKEKSFEEKLERLAEIVAKVENNVLPLSETLALYEEGNKLIDELQRELKEAELKLVVHQEEKSK